MRKNLGRFLLYWVAFVLIFSLLFFACLSAPASWERFKNTNYYLLRQIFLGFLPAIIAGLIAYKIKLETFKKWAPLLVLINLVAMFAVFLPFIGVKAGGAYRWINLGFFTIQPSEFLKITSILYLSAWIASKLSEEKVLGWKSITKKGSRNFLYIFVPFLVFMGLIAIALNLQSDASTLGIIAITLLVLYFSSKTPVWHTVLVILGGLGELLFMIRFEAYRLDRWLIFLNPEADPLGKGFQLRQSLISLGSGGVFGKGLGMSVQKFGFLPQAMTDSIFAIIGEELGIIGAVLVVTAFVLFFWLGIKVAKNSNDKFSRMVAVGIVSWITLQAFINILSAIGWFPITGIPLPFISYGGSHLVVELIGIGLLLNIAKNT